MLFLVANDKLIPLCFGDAENERDLVCLLDVIFNRFPTIHKFLVVHALFYVVVIAFGIRSTHQFSQKSS